ncbi:hypothetical protein FDUTEX481_02424 [Tolypothrix sp. PCC 7601]|nr:hypothetical protein FDUTEX481_02424 [Tolypothrix sp. PCC 7601]
MLLPIRRTTNLSALICVHPLLSAVNYFFLTSWVKAQNFYC